VLGQDVVIGSEPVRVEGTTTMVSEEAGLSESVPAADVVFVEK
jgi:alpha,alpha-trehalose phosphorylase